MAIDPLVASANLRNKGTYHCPKCGGELVRVHRRWVDRLWSLLVPVRRFRCSRMYCGRECNKTIPAGSTRYVWTAFVLLLAATTAGALVFSEYSRPPSHEPEVANDSVIDVGRPNLGQAAAPAAIAPLQSRFELSEPLPGVPLQSIESSDYTSNFLPPSAGGRSTNPGSADLNDALRALTADHR